MNARAATQPVVFISDAAESAVFEYPAGVSDPKPIARITTGVRFPLGVATDARGTLYVLNAPTSGPSNVTVYPTGQSTPSRTLTLPAAESYIAAGPDGTVYVEGYVPGAGNGVFEFFPGADTPSLVINAPSDPPVGFGPIAADAENDLYVTVAGGSCCGVGVFRYPPRSQNGTYYPGTAGAFGALAFDGTGDLLIARPYYKYATIRIVPPSGKATRFFSPRAIAMSFDAVDAALYIAYGTVSILDWNTKRPSGTIRAIYDATGIAVSPDPY
jgi:hypothetical protein